MTALREELNDVFIGNRSNAVVDAESPAMKRIEETCLANLEDTVPVPVSREKLRPNYRAACKRLIPPSSTRRGLPRPKKHLGHRLQELVSRRARHSGELAVDLCAFCRGDGRAKARYL